MSAATRKNNPPIQKHEMERCFDIVCLASMPEARCFLVTNDNKER
jgi:hypothetical protein